MKQNNLLAWPSLGISQDDYAALKLPILDLCGDNDLPPVLANAATLSKQEVIARATTSQRT